VFIVRTKEGDKVLLVLGQKTGVFIVRTKEGNKVLLVLGQKNGVHREDKRGEQSFTGLGSEDWCVHRED
jgi:hypothetical protein